MTDERDWTPHRARPGRFKTAGKQVRLAELLCGATEQRPTVFAVILGPRNSTNPEWRRVSKADGTQASPVGADFDAMCRCGEWHSVDGQLLKHEFEHARPGSARGPRIDVARVSFDTRATGGQGMP
jgi:hypothetical protein